MKKIVACIFISFFSFGFVHAQQKAERWSEQKIWNWYNQQPWYCGFNYIPGYAINYTAMWDKTSFNADAIDKELSLAEALG